jgi:hypothetical protein
LAKYGYKASMPVVTRSITSPDRIAIVVSKAQERLHEYVKPELMISNNLMGSLAGLKIRKSATRGTVDKPLLLATYISTFITALLSEYNNSKTTFDMREIFDIHTQGTADIFGRAIVTSSRNLVPAIFIMRKRVTKAQAILQQSQSRTARAAYVNRSLKRSR